MKTSHPTYRQHQTRPLAKEQRGVMLLEALLSILVFSVGVLAIIGLQAASVKQSSDAKYRSDASLLANELVGEMWVSDRLPATLQTNFATGGDKYNEWLKHVTGAAPYSAIEGLPGAVDNPPVVVVDTAPVTPIVTITLNWRAPYEPLTALHSYTVIAQIK